jgi:16S rRNA (guanine527-N7)-methyltransferase
VTSGGLSDDRRRLLREEAERVGVTLDPGQIEKLSRFVATIDAWAGRHRLIGTRDHHTLVTHHLVDSLAAAPCLGQRRMVLDIGSGAGLPGIPLAVACPDSTLVLLDSRRLACSFMRDAARRLRLGNVDVVEARIEHFIRETGSGGRRFEATIARAWTRLRGFLEASARVLAAGGIAVAMKGPGVDREIRACGDAALAFRPVHRIEYTLAGPRASNRVLVVFERLGVETAP